MNASTNDQPLVQFPQSLISGTLIRRYKRFLADVALGDGSVITAHCPNSGSMKTCLGEGWPVMMLKSDNPKRKCPFTLEMIHNGETWIVVNTNRANELAFAAIAAGRIPELSGYPERKREVRYGTNSRIDILLSDGDRRCYVEVKSVTMIDSRGRHVFPDAVTARGLKHLHELAAMVAQGHRAVMLYMVMREDGDGFSPAADIDPDYAAALRQVHAEGVEVLVWRNAVRPEGLDAKGRILNVVL